MKITAFNTAVKSFIAQVKGDCQKVEITRKNFFLILSLLKAAFPLAQFGALLMVKTQATPNRKGTLTLATLTEQRNFFLPHHPRRASVGIVHWCVL
jgi:hypothetical protein